jgi:hypothetical protein
MTVLGLTQPEVRDLLDVLDQLRTTGTGTTPLTPERADVLDRARACLSTVHGRRRALRGQADAAEGLTAALTLQLRRPGVAERFSPQAVNAPAAARTEVEA